ncbi:MAG: RNA polymerase sigma factor [Bacteroidia bacterium]
MAKDFDAHKSLDQKAFKTLFHNHYRLLFAVAIKMGADREMAKDVIQSLFLKLWEKRAHLNQVEHWPAYLKRALERDLVRAFDKKQRKQNLEEKNILEFETPSYESLLIQKEQNNKRSRDLQQALSKLPIAQKQVLQMRFQEGLSYEEIALSTGKSKQTVYNQIHSAIKRLKKALFLLVLLFKTPFLDFF